MHVEPNHQIGVWHLYTRTQGALQKLPDQLVKAKLEIGHHILEQGHLITSHLLHSRQCYCGQYHFVGVRGHDALLQPYHKGSRQ